MERQVIRKLHEGEYFEEKAKGNSPVWTSFVLIVDGDRNKVGVVKCKECNAILKYDAVKTGTSALLKHQRICHRKKPDQLPVGAYFKTGVSSKAKSAVLEKCIKVCAKDMRAFQAFESPAFTELAQVLMDTGATYGKCDAKELLPSGVTVSRHTQEKWPI